MHKNPEPLSDFARHHFGLGLAEGHAQGQAAALLLVLKARNLPPPEDVVERIQSCTDSAQLDAWIRAACTADRIEDVFGD